MKMCRPHSVERNKHASRLKSCKKFHMESPALPLTARGGHRLSTFASACLPMRPRRGGFTAARCCAGCNCWSRHVRPSSWRFLCKYIQVGCVSPHTIKYQHKKGGDGIFTTTPWKQRRHTDWYIRLQPVHTCLRVSSSSSPLFLYYY